MSALRNETSYSSYASFSPNSPTLTSATMRSAHEEATVEGVMNRWRVRPIYDNYSATVAPSAPDTMSVFLSLRADLLKSTLATAGSGGHATNTDTEHHDNNDDVSAAADQDEMGTNQNEGSKKNIGAATSRKDDYTVRHLRGELARLLEQLQVSNAETIQLKNQIAGMTKELSTRQRRITDLEETNRALVEQNQQLQQTVADLGATVSAVEESNMAQLLHGRAGPAASVMGGTVGVNGSAQVNGASGVPTAGALRQRGQSMRQVTGSTIETTRGVHWN